MMLLPSSQLTNHAPNPLKAISQIKPLLLQAVLGIVSAAGKQTKRKEIALEKWTWCWTVPDHVVQKSLKLVIKRIIEKCRDER